MKDSKHLKPRVIKRATFDQQTKPGLEPMDGVDKAPSLLPLALIVFGAVLGAGAIALLGCI